MALTFEKLRTPKPMQIVIPWEGDDLHVTYDRAAFTIEQVEGVYTTPIRQRLIQVLIGWDLLRDGIAWQPEPRDHPGWDAIALARRELRAISAAGGSTPLDDDTRAALHADPVTTDERRQAYDDAWEAILVQLPREFVKAVDGGILDDFLGVAWRGVSSVNGSAPTASTDAAPGGTIIPSN